MFNEDLFKIVASVLGVAISDLSLQSGPDELEEWNSLAHITICTAIEQACNVKFTMSEILAVRNISSLQQILKKHGVVILDSEFCGE